MITDRIDGLMIDSDEGGFYVILSGEKAEYRFNIQDVADEMLKQSWREIGPWWNEGQDARAQWKERTKEVPTDPEAYELRDPKHPSHHDIWTRSGGV